jgi:AcrR family transcriptional regulator
VPRFREEKKQSIHEKLVAEGKKLFQRYGLKKTNIEELADAAGIAKGTFYHFFESKEDLCLAIFDREEELMARDLEAIMSRYADPVRTFKTLIAFSQEFVRGDSLLVRLRESGEYEQLARGVSPEKLAAHLRHDEGTAAFFIKAMKTKGVRVAVKPDVLAGVLRAVVMLVMQDKVIGEHVFDRVMDLLAGWIGTGLLKGKARR